MNLIKYQIRKVFYNHNKTKKALVLADNHYHFLLFLQHLKENNMLIGTRTQNIPSEIWNYIIHSNDPSSNIMNFKTDFEKMIKEALSHK